MPSIIATILCLGGLAMFWLYFRISNDQSSVPDDHQADGLADEYGEVLTDQEHEVLLLANETHCQHHNEEDGMVLACWDRVLEIGLRTYVSGQSTDEDGDVLNSWAVELCNDWIRRERAAAGLPPFSDLGRPYDWEHWEFARPLIKLFWDFTLSVIGKALRHDPSKVTSQDIYEADAKLRAEGYWGRGFMSPFSREGDGEIFDRHLGRTEREGPMDGFRLRSLSCPAVVCREDFRVVEACACWRDDCPYRERMAKVHEVDVSTLDEWRKLGI